MSLVYSNTTTKGGIIQLIERKLDLPDGTITGDATLFARFTSDVNIALDRALSLIFESAGTWQFDDSNQTDYPIITTNLVSGQRDYSFTADSNGNLILDIFRVLIATSSGTFVEIDPVDQQSRNTNDPMTNTDGFVNGANATGLPTKYDKTANGIFLDPIPNYNYTNGLKIFINRESTYFTVSDTTKKPGFAGLFHEYLALRPAYQYAYGKTLSGVNVKSLGNDMLTMEAALKDYYTNRERDVRRGMRLNRESNK